MMLLWVGVASDLDRAQESATTCRGHARRAGSCIGALLGQLRRRCVSQPLSSEGVELPPGVHVPALPAPPAGGSGRCNDYLPGGSTLERFVWVVRFYAANGGSMPVAMRV